MPGVGWQPGGSATSLVFPVYNPRPALAGYWRRIEEFIRGAAGLWEVLFVCDGCTDGSPEKLTDWSAPYRSRVRVLSHQPNRGKGYAVYRGLAAARGRWRIFTDIDLAYG